MPSPLHETLIELFRERPALAAEVLTDPLGIPVPTFDTALLSSSDLTAVMSTEYRADAVVTFVVDDAPVHAVIVEVQLKKVEKKRRSWPAYVANLHSRLGCPVQILIVCPSLATARWCAEPIVVSDPGLSLTTLVLGPDAIPVVADPATAQRCPELTVLSAMAHGRRRRDRAPVLEAFLAALNVVDQEHAGLYADVVLAALPKAARAHLEVLMTTAPHRYQSDFARRYFAQGEAKGEAKGEARAVLAVLEARGIDVPATARDRIADCTDLDQLDTWIRRAATATTADELFA
ncbi:hypothetical protein GCM10009682_24420 [Luedemannella flava]|uniref:Uncharacterized protein n=1 Tax=Luedemannella flava TaxID=349316 RepID=A0ABP4Y8H5_9ACTN